MRGVSVGSHSGKGSQQVNCCAAQFDASAPAVDVELRHALGENAPRTSLASHPVQVRVNGLGPIGPVVLEV